MKKNKEQVDIGFIDVPKEYELFDDERKIKLCDNIIQSMLVQMDKVTPKYINRITFLNEILESSLITNEEQENFEVCVVLRDILKRLND
jgi:hypothetical protein